MDRYNTSPFVCNRCGSDTPDLLILEPDDVGEFIKISDLYEALTTQFETAGLDPTSADAAARATLRNLGINLDNA